MRFAAVIRCLTFAGLWVCLAGTAWGGPWDGKPKILLHAAAPTPINPCGTGVTFTDCQLANTKYGLYPAAGPSFVYLLVARGDNPDIAGLQVSLDYDGGNPAGRLDGTGIDIFAWVNCATMSFESGQWPAPGSGNRIAWDWNRCQRGEIAVAGYFYAAAYTPGVLQLKPFTPEGSAEIADCFASERAIDPSELGYVAFSAGAAAPGYNPCIERPVPGGLTATAVCATIHLSWDPVAWASGYHVRRDDGVLIGGPNPIAGTSIDDNAPGTGPRCYQVTGIDGQNVSGGYSTPACATVTDQPPAITQQPQSLQVAAFWPAAFSVAATATAPVGYLWRLNGTPLADGPQPSGSTLAGATTSALTVNDAQPADAGDYSVVVTDPCGSTTSAGAALSICPILTVTDPSDQTKYIGETAVFQVSAAGTAPVTSQWYRGTGTPLANGGNISGTNSTTLTLTGVASGDQDTYHCVVTDPCGQSAVSGAALLKVNACPTPPSITSHPVSLTRSLGQSAEFTVAATACVTPAYQWQKKDETTGIWRALAGATSATYVIPSVTVASAGFYRCVVAAGGLSSLSLVAALNRTGPNFIYSPTASLQNCTDLKITWQTDVPTQGTLRYARRTNTSMPCGSLGPPTPATPLGYTGTYTFTIPAGSGNVVDYQLTVTDVFNNSRQLCRSYVPQPPGSPTAATVVKKTRYTFVGGIPCIGVTFQVTNTSPCADINGPVRLVGVTYNGVTASTPSGLPDSQRLVVYGLAHGASTSVEMYFRRSLVCPGPCLSGILKPLGGRLRVASSQYPSPGYKDFLLPPAAKLP